jgi:hypothetical protein
VNKEIMEKAGFGDAVKAVENGECPFCHIKVNIMDFTDEMSRREYSISGICQRCQNETFGKTERRDAS